MLPLEQEETFATGMVRPKTTALFFDRLWVHPALIKGFDPDDGLECYRVPAELCVNQPMGVGGYYESWLAQRAYVASGRREVMYTDVRRTDVTDVLRRLSAETWDLNTIFRVEALQHFGDEESPLWKQFRERLDLETPMGGREGDWEMYLSTHQRNRAIAFIVQLYAARGIGLTPIYLTSHECDEVTIPESPGLEICLDEVPVAVDSELTWDQVFECRKDKDAVQKLKRLRRWFTMDLAQKSEREIKATLEEKLDKYQNALRKHGIATVLSGATSVLSFIAGPTALALWASWTSSPLAAAAGGVVLASGAVAWIGTKLIERSNIKRDEVAYIYDVKKLVA